MNLQAALSIYGGGPGSGCHGTACGRPALDVTKQKVGQQKGSNPGGTYIGSDGVKRYVKFYRNTEQAHGEVLANQIYKDLGLKVPTSTLIEKDGKTIVANDWIDGGKTLVQTGVTKSIANKIMDGFAADVLTANWDAVGLEHDNILVKDGDVTRMDQGGALLSRAMGGSKPAGVLNQISETKTLLNSDMNYAYAKVANAAGIKDAHDLGSRLSSQIKDIVSLRDQSGGWKNYIADNASYLTGQERDKIVGMLDSRTKLLEKLVK